MACRDTQVNTTQVETYDCGSSPKSSAHTKSTELTRVTMRLILLNSFYSDPLLCVVQGSSSSQTHSCLPPSPSGSDSA